MKRRLRLILFVSLPILVLGILFFYHPQILFGDSSIITFPDNEQFIAGAGPIRRYSGFRELWIRRRSTWTRPSPRDRNSVVFLGDSITEGWGDNFGGHFPGINVVNRGIEGDTTRGMLFRLMEDVISLQPSGVVLLMGTNDIEEGASPETIAGNVNLITDLLKEHNPQMPIILCLILPSSGSMKRPASTISKTNKYFIELAKSKPQITILDTWSMFATEQGDARLAEIPDLVHPNQLGYAKWATALRPMLAEIISRNCVIERRFASTLD